jgi:zinc transport system substrate-binding protein
MRIIPISVAAAIVVAGCGGTSTTANLGEVRVVAAFYPLAEAATQIGGRQVQVTNLTSPGAEPHDLEPTTRQVDAIEDADLVIEMGRGFQPGVEDAARRRGDDAPTLRILDALHLPAGTVGSEEHPGEGLDPHVWLDPVEMRAIVASVTDGITTALPAERRQAVRNRARRYDAELAALAGRYQRGLERCRSNTIVTSHAAFGWLARRYHLEQEAITGLSPEQEPNPKRLAQLARLVETKHVTTIFTETLLSPKVADTLARETGTTTAVLDPLEGLTAKRLATGADYITVMDENLDKLRAALGCD